MPLHVIGFGSVGKAACEEGRIIYKQLGVGFAANLGSRRCCVQLTLRMPDSERGGDGEGLDGE